MLIWAEIIVEIRHKKVMFRDKIYFIRIQFGKRIRRHKNIVPSF